jgi:3-oxoacyl-[acyl-carrier protein] reductase
VTTPSNRKCALITGAGSGIGAATALRFARAGYDVAINFSRNAEGAEAVAEQCRALGVSAITARGDIASDADCQAMVAATIEAFGRLDVLVNNAGVTRRADASDLAALDAGDFTHVFGVNVTGTYQMIRAAAPFLRDAPGASIVNISSDSGISGDGSSLAYAASKGALNTLTLGLARSLAPQIRVNAICPGFVDTTWALAWQDEAAYEIFKKNLRAIAPLHTIPVADDIANAAFFLAGDANCITGQLLVIDSGSHLTAGSPL